MNEHEALAMLLRSRGLLYAMLSRCFGNAPDKAMIDVLSSSEFDQICAVLDDGGGALSSSRASIENEVVKLGLDECRREYTACFIGPKTLVSPWESVYVTGEELVFQPCTLKVRDAYRFEGFEASDGAHEPDDHIATEADFLAKLAERALVEFESGETETALSTLEASRSFLVEHLGAWIADFSDALESAGPDGAIYWRMARFAVAFTDNDKALLGELIEAIA